MKPILLLQFRNEEVSYLRSLHGAVLALHAEPPALGLVAGSRLSRSQQLLLVQRFLEIPCAPSCAVDANNNGGLVLNRVLESTGGKNWLDHVDEVLRTSQLSSYLHTQIEFMGVGNVELAMDRIVCIRTVVDIVLGRFASNARGTYQGAV